MEITKQKSDKVQIEKYLYFFKYQYTTNRSTSIIMSVKELKIKIKNYFDKKMTESIQEMFGEPQEELSEEDIRRILYIIKFSDELVAEYGSIDRWRKVMQKGGYKPYMYFDIKELMKV